MPTKELRIENLLEQVVTKKASDLHLQVGLAPTLRIDGHLTPAQGGETLTPEAVESIVFAILDEEEYTR